MYSPADRAASEPFTSAIQSSARSRIITNHDSASRPGFNICSQSRQTCVSPPCHPFRKSSRVAVTTGTRRYPVCQTDVYRPSNYAETRTKTRTPFPKGHPVCEDGPQSRWVSARGSLAPEEVETASIAGPSGGEHRPMRKPFYRNLAREPRAARRLQHRQPEICMKASAEEAFTFNARLKWSSLSAGQT